ncbi:MAG: GTP cyclohydrolase II RibA [Variovorax sp.]|nr:MAG: GTP cyclohydrolase II RibA [Variovorax sp.]
MNDQAPVTIRSEVLLPLDGGDSPTLITFTGFSMQAEHFALCFGEALSDPAPLVRVHSECITGDLFRSQRCDCGAQLEQTQAMIAAEGGLIVYLRQEGRGIGLYAKVDAYRLQDSGMDTFAANEYLSLPRDGRDYTCAAQMLEALGVRRLRLITNNPEKARQLVNAGLDVVAVLPTATFKTPYNLRYLKDKAIITKHRLDIQPSRHSRDPAMSS